MDRVKIDPNRSKLPIKTHILAPGYVAMRIQDISKMIDTSQMKNAKSDMRLVLSSSERFEVGDVVYLIPGSQPMEIVTNEGRLVVFHESSVFAVQRLERETKGIIE
jgi:hypothetical protein